MAKVDEDEAFHEAEDQDFHSSDIEQHTIPNIRLSFRPPSLPPSLPLKDKSISHRATECLLWPPPCSWLKEMIKKKRRIIMQRVCSARRGIGGKHHFSFCDIKQAPPTGPPSDDQPARTTAANKETFNTDNYITILSSAATSSSSKAANNVGCTVSPMPTAISFSI
eukprot:scaffold344_cov132-Skeletonema_menzelii.AAC.14